MYSPIHPKTLAFMRYPGLPSDALPMIGATTFSWTTSVAFSISGDTTTLPNICRALTWLGWPECLPPASQFTSYSMQPPHLSLCQRLSSASCDLPQ